MIISPIRSLLVAVIVLLILNSCNSGKCPLLPEPFANNTSITKDFFDNYFLASSGYSIEQSQGSDSVNIYVDRSSGINEAFSAGSESANVATEITNQFASTNAVKTNVFDVNENIQPNPVKLDALVNFISDKGNFADDKLIADQKKALDAMTNSKCLSFLISDCELVVKGSGIEPKESWARNSFTSWLNKGNRIDIWACSYSVKKGSKYMYFIAFVPNKMGPNVNKNYTSLQSKLNNMNKVLPFSLSKKSWNISLDKNIPVEGTGINANLSDPSIFEKKSYIRELSLSPSGYEYIEIQMPLDAIKNQISPKGSAENFYSKLLMDLSKVQFFNINAVELKVYNINEDFKKFSNWYYLTKNGPSFIIDSKTKEKKLNPDSCSSQYFDQDGQIKEKYSPSYSKNAVKELFKFNTALFNSTRTKDLSQSELGIELHDRFNPAEQSLNTKDAYNLIRIDFVIPASGSSSNPPDLEKFKWTVDGKENNALKNSISNVIETDIKPDDKIIHTIFLKLITK